MHGERAERDTRAPSGARHRTVRAGSRRKAKTVSDAGSEALERLQDVLGHRFNNIALLERALLHASVHQSGQGESNERLEFLGDRVLGLVIASALYARDPHASEGDLARRLNALVRRETCADRALALGIDEALRLGVAEVQTGGRQKVAILADACEAVLAAVFLDAGYEKSVTVVTKAWQPLLSEAETLGADPKTTLQERLQSVGEAPPAYRLRERTGPDHRPHFVVEVVGAAGVLAAGEGASKREAEQNAARAALATL